MKFEYFDALSGDPIFIHGVGHCRSPYLKELCPSGGVGYSRYNLYLGFLSWDKDKLIQSTKLAGIRITKKLATSDKLNVYDVATLLPQMREFYREILSFFMLEDVEWDDTGRRFVTYAAKEDKKYAVGEINRENFEEVRLTLLQLNFVGIDKDDGQVKHTNARSKELWEKAQKFLKEQAAAEEHRDKPEYHIGNIISKLCSAHPTYNLLNIWRLTVFQLYDAFFQFGYMRSADLNEEIFSNHGGEKFNFEDWLKPILKNV